MTLYFDSKVELLESDAVSTIGIWHSSKPLFAVASFSQNRGGSVTIFSDAGEPLKDVSYPVHSSSQITALTWHPEKPVLATGWENGDIYVWFTGQREFAHLHGPHKASIMFLAFSELGGRMVSTDSMGLLTGWRCSEKHQFLTMFSHDLRENLLHITFRRVIENEINEEMALLAKAAVAGDENALDTLTSWRPRTASKILLHSSSKDNYCFYAGTQSGVIYYINQSGTCTEVMKNSSGAIRQIVWHPKKDVILCLMENMTVVLYLVESTGLLTELDRIKLSGRSVANHSVIAWASSELAIITGEFRVRMWDIERGINFVLPMDSLSCTNAARNSSSNVCYREEYNYLTAPVSQQFGIDRRQPKQADQQNGEAFTCLAYSQTHQILCAGTNRGNVYMWKRTSLGSSFESCWQLINTSSIREPIKQCYWGVNETAKPCVMVVCMSNIYILKEQPLLFFHMRDLWAVQRSSRSIYLEHYNGQYCTVQTDFAVTALALNQLYLILSNGCTISSYKIETNEENAPEKVKRLIVQKIQTFAAECLGAYIYNQNIFCLTSNNILIYSVGGIVLNRIQTSDDEGKIIGLDLTSTYLTIFTMNGFIRTYDVTSHEPKLIFPGKSGYDLFEDFGEVIFAKCNCAGTHLAVIIANQNLAPKAVVYCWEIERNLLMKYKFCENGAQKSSLPVSIYWDTDEARLLVVEFKSVYQLGSQHSNSKDSTKLRKGITNVGSEAVVLFYSENEIYFLQTTTLSSSEQLINLCVPNVVIWDINTVKGKLLQNFLDLDCDSNTRKSVLRFSMHVAEGNMDLAYRCIRSLKSKTIWSNLAKMCFKTKRLDISKVCMGHLEQARSVRAIRQALENEDLELDAKVAILAAELGMTEEAQEMFRSCGRADLLNKLLLSSGQLQRALEVSEREDRVSLKTIYFRMGKEQREAGDLSGALEYFHKTQNPVQNITQMLLESPVTMKQYMETTTDSQMLKWWGQYLESTGDLDAALTAYQKADDWFSQVKVLCYLGKISKADAIASRSGNRAACYHLARHYENIGKFQEAIIFYTKAQTFSNAVRICRENDFQDELWTVAGFAKTRDKAVAAAYFEECGSYKRAVELYHQAGMLHKALEMAFESEHLETLDVIASELTAESDPELIIRCAEFFISREQHQKAVLLYATTNNLQTALRICSEKGVPITDTLANMLTPSKEDSDEEIRVSLLTKLGELLQEQGDYQNAAKKFTQAGDKVRAMKSLLKSGNTDKIIFFANISRQREVYVMAANYLQALNWQENPSVLKNIVAFYSKGQAFDSLANFYAIYAQIEIDDFCNYEKALMAMQDAATCLQRLGHSQQAANNLQRTISQVKQVLELQTALENDDYQTVVSGCRALLDKAETPPVRHVHILSMLVKALVFSKQYAESGRALKQLAAKDTSWSALRLLDKAMDIRMETLDNVKRRSRKKLYKSSGVNSKYISESLKQYNLEIAPTTLVVFSCTMLCLCWHSIV